MTSENVTLFKKFITEVVTSVKSDDYLYTGNLFRKNKRKVIIERILNECRGHLVSLKQGDDEFIYMTLVSTYVYLMNVFNSQLVLTKAKVKVDLARSRDELVKKLKIILGTPDTLKHQPVSMASPEEYNEVYKNGVTASSQQAYSELVSIVNELVIIKRAVKTRNVPDEDIDAVLGLQLRARSVVAQMYKILNSSTTSMEQLRRCKTMRLILSRLSPHFQRLLNEPMHACADTLIIPPKRSDVCMIERISMFNLTSKQMNQYDTTPVSNGSSSSRQYVTINQEHDMLDLIENFQPYVHDIRSPTFTRLFHRFFGPWVYQTPESSEIFDQYASIRQLSHVFILNPTFRSISASVNASIPLQTKKEFESDDEEQYEEYTKKVVDLRMEELALSMESIQINSGMTKEQYKRLYLDGVSDKSCMSMLVALLQLAVYYSNRYCFDTSVDLKQLTDDYDDVDYTDFNRKLCSEIYDTESARVYAYIRSFFPDGYAYEQVNSDNYYNDSNSYTVPDTILMIWKFMDANIYTETRPGEQPYWRKSVQMILNLMASPALRDVDPYDWLEFPLSEPMGHFGYRLSPRHNLAGLAHFRETVSLYESHFLYHVETDISIYPVLTGVLKDATVMKALQTYVNKRNVPTTTKSFVLMFCLHKFRPSSVYHPNLHAFTTTKSISSKSLFALDQHNLHRSLTQLDSSAYADYESMQENMIGDFETAYDAFFRVFSRLIKNGIPPQMIHQLKIRGNIPSDLNASWRQNEFESSVISIKNLLDHDIFPPNIAVYMFYMNKDGEFEQDRKITNVKPGNNKPVLSFILFKVDKSEDSGLASTWKILKHDTRGTLLHSTSYLEDKENFADSEAMYAYYMDKLQGSVSKKRRLDPADKQEEEEEEDSKRPESKLPVNNNDVQVDNFPSQNDDVDDDDDDDDDVVELSSTLFEHLKKVNIPTGEIVNIYTMPSVFGEFQAHTLRIKNGIKEQILTNITRSNVQKYSKMLLIERMRYQFTKNNRGELVYTVVPALFSVVGNKEKQKIVRHNEFNCISSVVMNWFMYRITMDHEKLICMDTSAIQIDRQNGSVRLTSSAIINLCFYALFAEDFMFIPVNITNHHWILLVLYRSNNFVGKKCEILVFVYDDLVVREYKEYAEFETGLSLDRAKLVINEVCKEHKWIADNYEFVYHLVPNFQNFDPGTNSCGYYVMYIIQRYNALLNAKKTVFRSLSKLPTTDTKEGRWDDLFRLVDHENSKTEGIYNRVIYMYEWVKFCNNLSDWSKEIDFQSNDQSGDQSDDQSDKETDVTTLFSLNYLLPSYNSFYTVEKWITQDPFKSSFKDRELIQELKSMHGLTIDGADVASVSNTSQYSTEMVSSSSSSSSSSSTNSGKRSLPGFLSRQSTRSSSSRMSTRSRTRKPDTEDENKTSSGVRFTSGKPATKRTF